MENVLEIAREKFELAERGLESAKSRYKRQLLTRDTYEVLEASYIGQMKALYPIIKRLESLQAK